MPDLCWDGCQTGIQEEGSALHRVSPSTFHISFRVPDAAWFEGTGGGEAYVHPLTSGSYSIGIECVTVSSGCATQPADAQVMVHLTAPPPTSCASGKTCATLNLSSSVAQVGDVITFHGRAPLEMMIGRPWGMNLVVSLVMKPSTTWADLGQVGALSSTWSGVDGMQAQTGSSLVAWCQPSAIVITGGSSPRRLPIAGVALALRGTNLKAWGGGQPFRRARR
jgi:hypothetical protein